MCVHLALRQPIIVVEAANGRMGGATYRFGRGINRMGNEGHNRKDDEGGEESELHLGNGDNGWEGRFVWFELWGTD
jgi:hypothetical protein